MWTFFDKPAFQNKMIDDMLKLYLELWRRVQIKLIYSNTPDYTDFWSVLTSTPLIRFEKILVATETAIQKSLICMGMDKLSLFPIFPIEKLPSRLGVILQVSTGTQVIYELW